MKDSRIVCIGGGTGLSTMLRGIKEHTENLTAIVTVADNGGSSGILRREMNMLPPGDIRNCLLALAHVEPVMHKVFNYRFTEGSLDGQNFGNLFIAALNDVCGSFEMAVEMASEVLAVKGKVLPVTTENVELCAIHNDGSVTEGECEIVLESKRERKPINSVFLKPCKPKPYFKAIEAINEADVIVLGPGSLYTSIVPNLLVEGVCAAINASSAKKIYVSNIMTQPGETDKYTLKMHLNIIERYIGKNSLDYIIVNNEPIDEELLFLYEEDGAEQVIVDLVGDTKTKIISGPLVKIDETDCLIRHDHNELAKIIMNL
jgi:uncharacterized cofD-like protein